MTILSEPPSTEDRIKTLLDTIESLWGAEDHRYKRISQHWLQFFPDDDSQVRERHWRLAEMYLSWALHSPYAFDDTAVTYDCNCYHGSGWVCVNEEQNEWRPCSRCNRDTYEFLMTGVIPGGAPTDPGDTYGYND